MLELRSDGRGLLRQLCHRASAVRVIVRPRCRTVYRSLGFVALGAWSRKPLWRFGLLLPFAVALVGHRGGAGAQVPPSSVGVSSVVDTSLTDVRDVVRLVRAYLAKVNDTSAVAQSMWSRADARDRRFGDLTRFFAYYGNPAMIVGVTSAGQGDTLFVVKVLHASVDSTRHEIEPWALQRLYAIRAPEASYKWRLSAPLMRNTRHWTAKSVGTITFYYAPGQTIDLARARMAARFVDSVATLFAVRPPARLDYFVTASPDEYFRAVGLDFLLVPSGSWEYGGGAGGNAIPEVGIVLAGDPRQREAYLHELVHAVLGRSYGGVFLAEGIATWLGGSRGRTSRDTYRHLREYQDAHPHVTLEALVRGDAGWGVRESDARYATGALFVDAMYRRGGVTALRSLRDVSNDPPRLLSAMRERLGLLTSDPTALDRWWREATRDAMSSR